MNTISITITGSEAEKYLIIRDKIRRLSEGRMSLFFDKFCQFYPVLENLEYFSAELQGLIDQISHCQTDFPTGDDFTRASIIATLDAARVKLDSSIKDFLISENPENFFLPSEE